MSLYDRDYMRERRPTAPEPADGDGGGKRSPAKLLAAGCLIALLILMLLAGAGRCG